MQTDLIIIIGAGVSGLAAAKYAKQYKLNFIVFQKASDIGGVWNPVDGLVWKSMHTNISKQNCKFTDFDWPFQPKIFPTNQQFFRYLKAYAQHFQIAPYITFNSQVKSLSKDPSQDIYQVIVDVDGHIKQYVAAHVIIASGLYSKEYIPNDVKGLEIFKGDIHHSRRYKENTIFDGKKVLVVGGSYTAIELATDISHKTQPLYHSFRSPFIVRTHYLKTKQKTQVPLDLLLYKRKENSLQGFLITQQFLIAKHEMILQVCNEQQEIPSLKIHPQDLSKPLSNNISTGYVKNVKQGKIIPKRSCIKELKEYSVVLDNEKEQEEIQIDAVIFCTGYLSSLFYLSEEIQKLIQLIPQVQKHPTVMYKSVLHPQLKGLHFCGIYRGGMVPVCEMQAKFAVYLISGKGNYPTQEQFRKDIQMEKAFRAQRPLPQNRYPVYPAYCDQLAVQLGLPHDLQTLKATQPEKYHKYINLPLIQQINNLTTIDIDTQIENIEKAIKECTFLLEQ